MPKTLPFLLGALLAAALGCSSSRPVQRPAPTTPSTVELSATADAPSPAAPARSCDELTRDAHVLVSEHAACKQDADCAMTNAACPPGFTCGRGVRASDVEEVNRALADLSQQFGARCGPCARDRVRCMTPNPICREGVCVHEATTESCNQLDREAKALVAAHDACASDDDCVLARDEGGCADAFACGSVVNKRQADAFIPLASELSRTYREHCGRCTRLVAECGLATPFCSEGHCSRRYDP